MTEPEIKLVPDDEEEPEPQEPEEPAEDKTKKNEEPPASKPVKSIDFQKKVWRDRAQKAEKDVEDLRKDLAELRALVAKPTSEQEAKAQEYIRDQARRVFSELKAAEKKAEDEAAKEIEGKIAEIIEENPDVSEDELLEVMEDEEVEPEIALKMLRRGATKKKEKPKMPEAKRGSPASEPQKADDKGKSFWDIAREEVAKVKS